MSWSAGGVSGCLNGPMGPGIVHSPGPSLLQEACLAYELVRGAPSFGQIQSLAKGHR